MLELKQIKDLMAAMGRHGTKRLELRHEGFELVLEKESTGPEHIIATPPPPPEFSTSHRQYPSFTSPEEGKPSQETPKEEVKGHVVRSPMVGTFYTSPSPDAPPFVKEGDSVQAESVICIIEAMKVMNEVKAGVAGRVTKVFLRSGDPVEYGSPLFVIE